MSNQTLRPRMSALLALLLMAMALGGVGRTKTAYQFLQESEKPHFRQGHTLPRLTRWGWTMAYDTRVELCENWGYALEFGGYATSAAVAKLNDPTSVESRLCALTASDPQRYPLCVLLYRPFGNSTFVNALPESTWCHDALGNRLTSYPQWKQYSPIMPDSNYQLAAQQGAAPLARILQACPISIVLNGGEYALSVYGHSGPVWGADPAVVAAKGDQSWYDFISARKAHYEQYVTDAVLAQAPGLDQYLFYYTDGSPDRNRYAGYWEWVWDYSKMRTISTLPNSSMYYLDFNSGWTGDNDMLTQSLNSIAYQTSFGDALSYNWVCSGYKEGKFSDDPHYMGYLKCYYTAGMIGGIAGYFTSANFSGDLGASIPSWLQQMMTLGHVHALFSHLEDFQRRGDVLPGPNMHKWSTDLPAYEFPTGDTTVRVLARKHRERPEWLLCAWAAGGENRNVTVTIPELGDVTLFARDCGTLYRAKPGPVLIQLDPEGMLPSLHLNDITATCGPNGTISAPGYVAVPDGGSETYTFTPDPGYMVADVQVDGASVGQRASYTFMDVQAPHTIHVSFARPLTAVTLEATPPAPQQPGTPLTLTATRIGASPQVEYRFYAAKPGEVLQRLSNYTPTNTCRYTTSTQGVYQFVVWARVKGSLAPYDVYASITYRVMPRLTSVALTATPPAPQAPGTAITLTATPAGWQEAEYRVYIAEPGGPLTLVRQYSTQNTYNFTPTQPGRHQFLVYARAVGSTETKQAYKSMTYNVIAQITGVTLTTDTPGGTVNRPITLTAQATGGNKVEYRYFVAPPGLAYASIQPYTVGATTCAYTPTLPGKYLFLVWAREVGSSQGKDAYKVLSYTVNP